ncbi:hypothetical protein HYH03_002839 [Edaphochlamys debaryana]|uniref:Uncharacterized protein n=1 Tax=Edaphochlamys debaryana TaxID=47281 RepID=A0A835YAA4_9CHLO|nr:hypothetical protein HYH03_002839 [Edaphochlamys debaryana]|eukprot:KAG2499260.1 hypothetical protein HYH03_002839 [Edaphochlamys debaryana]
MAQGAAKPTLADVSLSPLADPLKFDPAVQEYWVKLSDDAPGPHLTFSARIVGTEAEPAEGLELEVWNSLDQVNTASTAHLSSGQPLTVRIKPKSSRLSVYIKRRGQKDSIACYGFLVARKMWPIAGCEHKESYDVEGESVGAPTGTCSTKWTSECLHCGHMIKEWWDYNA